MQHDAHADRSRSPDHVPDADVARGKKRHPESASGDVDTHEHRETQLRGEVRGQVRGPLAVTVAQLPDFDEVIDVRSESEFADDHIPGAINCPVLDNSERALVGTVYKQSSSFDAKRIGASLVAANIARHIGSRFNDRPRTWRPLVYCWRGGGRSEALAHVLSQVGWKVARLDGGYKAYRRTVVADLETLPRAFEWRVLCGLTGTGKSRLLNALEAAGAQVLDLERMAAHRGSVLGNIPDEPQPTQKMFDSLLWGALRGFDPKRPVFVEGESRKIGRIRVPEALIDSMWASRCVLLDAPMEVRVQLLKEEYAHYISAPDALSVQLECLTVLHGKETIQRWQQLAFQGEWDRFVEELLVQHYDPAYLRSTLKHYAKLEHAPRRTLDASSPAAFESVAHSVLDDDSGGVP